jgi:hypothetical protein
MPRKSVWNKRVEMGRQKREPKVRGQNGNLKENSFPSLHFFYSLWFFFSFAWEEKNCHEKAFET